MLFALLDPHRGVEQLDAFGQPGQIIQQEADFRCQQIRIERGRTRVVLRDRRSIIGRSDGHLTQQRGIEFTYSIAKIRRSSIDLPHRCISRRRHAVKVSRSNQKMPVCRDGVRD
jgi:hypothetical protein